MFVTNPLKRPSLRFFAPVEEGSAGGQAPASDPDPAGPAAPAEPAAPAADPQPTDPPAGDAPETFSKEYVEKLRREAAGYREKAKTDAAAAAVAARSEITQQLGKALGLVKDDEKADPDALVAQAQADRQAAIDDARATKVELAVLRAADKHNADVEVLQNWTPFTNKAKGLDTTADDFAEQLDALIKEFVDGNPARFKRAQVAASTGGTQHSGETAPVSTENKSIEQLREERRKRRGITL